MFNSIRVKFSLMFAIMATALIVMAITDATQSRSTLKQMQEFSPEESPDDLQINHQIRVEAHLVA
ncbi:hypothetical protein [Shewanella xiamenensis]|uniref:hypothetical protein n=1 Tax=Shewanella xiamenensis TaxID=332186 RepID=UPI0008498350|nr:hypothetical protein [Shewanella xiamenensis]ODR84237.1 hypothetical protein ABT47_02315 [Shewanella xiamenensis]